MQAVRYFVELFAVTFVGVLVACKIVGYDISMARKVGAAGFFALAYSIPLPIGMFVHLIPPVGMYMCLMDARNDRAVATRVFAVAYLIAAVSVFVLAYLQLD